MLIFSWLELVTTELVITALTVLRVVTKQRLAQAEQGLADKIGHDMVTKQSMVTLSAYQKFMRTTNTADKPAMPADCKLKRNNSSNNSKNGPLTIGATKLTTRHSTPSC